MRRQFLRQLKTRLHALSERWYFRPFRALIADSRLFALQRRGVTGAFAVGLAICFIPLPVHTPLAIAVALWARLNLPVIIATIYLINPLTIVPVYYAAYLVGAAVLGYHRRAFHFRLSWEWLQYGLGPLWKPFLLGCAICAVLSALFGWMSLEFLWRWRVRRRYRERHRRVSP